MSTLIFHSKLMNTKLMRIPKSLISFIYPSIVTSTSVYLPRLRRTSLSNRPPRQIRRRHPPEIPMPTQSRTLQHALRRIEPHRWPPLRPRHLLPFQLRPGDLALYRRLCSFVGRPCSTHLYRGRPSRALPRPSVPFRAGCVLPAPRCGRRLPALLAGPHSLRSHPPESRRGLD